MTHSLEELIESSGQNAEDKGFHDDGNILRSILGHVDGSNSSSVIVSTAYGEVQLRLTPEFWKRLYAAYQGNRLMLIVSEVVEAHDEVRNGKPSIYEGENGKPEGVAVELADAEIRLKDYAWEFNEPVVEAIDAKAAYNKTRERMHGGKLS